MLCPEHRWHTASAMLKGGASGPPADLFASEPCWPKVTSAVCTTGQHLLRPPTGCVVLPAPTWMPGVLLDLPAQGAHYPQLESRHFPVTSQQFCTPYGGRSFWLLSRTHPTPENPQKATIRLFPCLNTPPHPTLLSFLCDAEHSLGWHPSKFSDKT